ncbi:MAG: replicative DNA helicase [Thermocrinis sp.]|jgi:replicative DNA helicase|uniref:replicative DNA helicase n=1 Tax=Thermocrinis sp. TaxID=2024383 RepID=UPI003BFD3282
MHIKSAIEECLVFINMARQSDRLVIGLPTGFLDLDRLTTGFHPGELVVVAGRTGVGKTGFMLSMAVHLAFNMKVPVAIFSLETSKHQLLLRMLSILSGVPLWNIRIGFVSDEAWRKLAKLGGELAGKRFYIDDSPRLSVAELRERSKRLREEKGIEVIFVDYLQLLKGPFARNTRQEEVADISIELKALAKELQIPVVVLAQLSRQVERRQDKRPQLMDLRDSGQIEEVADMVLFIHRQEERVAELIVAKNRQGPTGMVKLVFEKDTTAFKPLYFPDSRKAERYNPEDLENFDLDF